MTNKFEEGVEAVGHFFVDLVHDIEKAKKIFEQLQPEVKAVIIPVFQQVVVVVKDAEEAAAQEGMNIVLDLQTVTDLKALIAAAKAGDTKLVADFKSLGITL